MDKIKIEHKEDLIDLIKTLIDVINEMQRKNNSYILVQNKNEAIEWLDFLVNHNDKDELKSLEDEIADRFFSKFDVQVECSTFDYNRTKLMKDFLFKANDYLIV